MAQDVDADLEAFYFLSGELGKNDKNVMKLLCGSASALFQYILKLTDSTNHSITTIVHGTGLFKTLYSQQMSSLRCVYAHLNRSRRLKRCLGLLLHQEPAGRRDWLFGRAQLPAVPHGHVPLPSTDPEDQ